MDKIDNLNSRSLMNSWNSKNSKEFQELGQTSLRESTKGSQISMGEERDQLR